MIAPSISKSPKNVLRQTIFAIVILVLAFTIPFGVVQAYSGYPTFDIVSVSKDVSVTVQTKNLPPDQTFTVRMGKIGTKAVGGEIVNTFDSGDGGSQKLTFNIPASLKGLAQIAIRMDSPSGYFAYNWFTNSTAVFTPSATTTATKTPTTTATKTPSATTTATTKPGYTGIPTFSIVSVVKDSKVTIKTNNFPANQTFTVRMGAYGTKGIGGTVIGTTDSAAGGAFEATYTIPDALKGSSRIAIRLDSPSGYFAYNWFYNGDSTGSVVTTPAAPGYSGIPTFSIKSVVQDTSVTIKTSTFPAKQTFTVKMGAYGTKGIDGTVVGTTDSAAGGAFEANYTIPAALKGAAKIAIRLESENGYYAYNWFYNTTAP
ncbi:MAG: hypothetical protein ACYC3H_00695 [Bellilinea sp.]